MAAEIRPLVSGVAVPSMPPSVAVVERKRPGQAGPTVYLVRDAHVNESAQRNIARVLERLIRSGRADLVLVEGGWGDLSLSSIKRSAGESARRAVADRFLRKGWIQAADYAQLISAEFPPVFGADDEALYREGVAFYAELVRHREGALAWLALARRLHTFLKSRFYAPALSDLDAARTAYRNSERSFLDYLRMLSDRAQTAGLSTDGFEQARHALKLHEHEKTIDFEAAQREHLALLQELDAPTREELADASRDAQHRAGAYRAGQAEDEGYFALLASKASGRLSAYPALSRYLDYAAQAGRLNAEALVDETARLETAVFTVMASTAREQELIGMGQGLEILEALFQLKLDPSQWERVRRNPAAFHPQNLAAALNSALVESGTRHEFALFWDESLERAYRTARDFYENAARRDERFVERVQAQAREHSAKHVVLVAGGFHTARLEHMLAQRGLGFASIRPQVTAPTNARRYESLLLGSETAPDGNAQNPARQIAVPPAPILRVGSKPVLELLELELAVGARMAAPSGQTAAEDLSWTDFIRQFPRKVMAMFGGLPVFVHNTYPTPGGPKAVVTAWQPFHEQATVDARDLRYDQPAGASVSQAQKTSQKGARLADFSREDQTPKARQKTWVSVLKNFSISIPLGVLPFVIADVRVQDQVFHWESPSRAGPLSNAVTELFVLSDPLDGPDLTRATLQFEGAEGLTGRSIARLSLTSDRSRIVYTKTGTLSPHGLTEIPLQPVSEKEITQIRIEAGDDASGPRHLSLKSFNLYGKVSVWDWLVRRLRVGQSGEGTKPGSSGARLFASPVSISRTGFAAAEGARLAQRSGRVAADRARDLVDDHLHSDSLKPEETRGAVEDALYDEMREELMRAEAAFSKGAIEGFPGMLAVLERFGPNGGGLVSKLEPYSHRPDFRKMLARALWLRAHLRYDIGPLSGAAEDARRAMALDPTLPSLSGLQEQIHEKSIDLYGSWSESINLSLRRHRERQEMEDDMLRRPLLKGVRELRRYWEKDLVGTDDRLYIETVQHLFSEIVLRVKNSRYQSTDREQDRLSEIALASLAVDKLIGYLPTKSSYAGGYSRAVERLSEAVRDLFYRVAQDAVVLRMRGRGRKVWMISEEGLWKEMRQSWSDALWGRKRQDATGENVEREGELARRVRQAYQPESFGANMAGSVPEFWREEWDSIDQLYENGFPGPISQAVLQRLDLAPGDTPSPLRVLEIGSSPQPFLAEEVLERFPQLARLETLDIVEPRRIAPSKHAKRLRYRQASATRTGYPGGHFDRVITVFTYEYTDLDQSLAELRRIMAPGGKAILVLHHSDSGIAFNWAAEVYALDDLAQKLGRVSELVSRGGGAASELRSLLNVSDSRAHPRWTKFVQHARLQMEREGFEASVRAEAESLKGWALKRRDFIKIFLNNMERLSDETAVRRYVESMGFEASVEEVFFSIGRSFVVELRRRENRSMGGARLAETAPSGLTPDDVLKNIQRGLEASPYDPHLHYLRGSVYADLGRPDDAVEQIAKAIDLLLNPQQPLERRSGSIVFKAIAKTKTPAGRFFDQLIEQAKGLQASAAADFETQVTALWRTAEALAGSLSDLKRYTKYQTQDMLVYFLWHQAHLVLMQDRAADAWPLLTAVHAMTDRHHYADPIVRIRKSLDLHSAAMALGRFEEALGHARRAAELSDQLLAHLRSDPARAPSVFSRSRLEEIGANAGKIRDIQNYAHASIANISKALFFLKRHDESAAVARSLIDQPGVGPDALGWAHFFLAASTYQTRPSEPEAQKRALDTVYESSMNVIQNPAVQLIWKEALILKTLSEVRYEFVSLDLERAAQMAREGLENFMKVMALVPVDAVLDDIGSELGRQIRRLRDGSREGAEEDLIAMVELTELYASLMALSSRYEEAERLIRLTEDADNPTAGLVLKRIQALAAAEAADKGAAQKGQEQSQAGYESLDPATRRTLDAFWRLSGERLERLRQANEEAAARAQAAAKREQIDRTIGFSIGDDVLGRSLFQTLSAMTPTDLNRRVRSKGKPLFPNRLSWLASLDAGPGTPGKATPSLEALEASGLRDLDFIRRFMALERELADRLPEILRRRLVQAALELALREDVQQEDSLALLRAGLDHEPSLEEKTGLIQDPKEPDRIRFADDFRMPDVPFRDLTVLAYAVSSNPARAELASQAAAALLRVERKNPKSSEQRWVLAWAPEPGARQLHDELMSLDAQGLPVFEDRSISSEDMGLAVERDDPAWLLRQAREWLDRARQIHPQSDNALLLVDERLARAFKILLDREGVEPEEGASFAYAEVPLELEYFESYAGSASSSAGARLAGGDPMERYSVEEMRRVVDALVRAGGQIPPDIERDYFDHEAVQAAKGPRILAPVNFSSIPDAGPDKSRQWKSQTLKELYREGWDKIQVLIQLSRQGKWISDLSHDHEKLILRAYVLAFAAHQFFPAKPSKRVRRAGAGNAATIIHPVDVAVSVAAEFGRLKMDLGVVKTETILAALLHDTMEDTRLSGIGLDDFRRLLRLKSTGSESQMARRLFDLVSVLSKKTDADGREESDKDYFLRMIRTRFENVKDPVQALYRAMLIKLADKLNSARHDLDLIGVDDLDRRQAEAILKFHRQRRDFAKYFANFVFRSDSDFMVRAALYWAQQFFKVVEFQRRRIQAKGLGDLLVPAERELSETHVRALEGGRWEARADGEPGTLYRVIDARRLDNNSFERFTAIINRAFPPFSVYRWLDTPEKMREALSKKRNFHAQVLIFESTGEIAGGYVLDADQAHLYPPVLVSLVADEAAKGSGATHAMLADLRRRFFDNDPRRMIMLRTLPSSLADRVEFSTMHVQAPVSRLEELLNIGPTRLINGRGAGARLSASVHKSAYQALEADYAKAFGPDRLRGARAWMDSVWEIPIDAAKTKTKKDPLHENIQPFMNFIISTCVVNGNRHHGQADAARMRLFVADVLAQLETYRNIILSHAEWSPERHAAWISGGDILGRLDKIRYVLIPLMSRLGLDEQARQISDLLFFVIDPFEYQKIIDEVLELGGQRDILSIRNSLEQVRKSLEDQLKARGLTASVSFSIKDPYSIHEKLKSRTDYQKISDLPDIFRFQIVFDASPGKDWRETFYATAYPVVQSAIDVQSAVFDPKGPESVHVDLVDRKTGMSYEIQAKSSAVDRSQRAIGSDTQRNLKPHWIYKTERFFNTFNLGRPALMPDSVEMTGNFDNDFRSLWESLQDRIYVVALVERARLFGWSRENRVVAAELPRGAAFADLLALDGVDALMPEARGYLEGLNGGAIGSSRQELSVTSALKNGQTIRIQLDTRGFFGRPQEWTPQKRQEIHQSAVLIRTRLLSASAADRENYRREGDRLISGWAPRGFKSEPASTLLNEWLLRHRLASREELAEAAGAGWVTSEDFAAILRPTTERHFRDRGVDLQRSETQAALAAALSSQGPFQFLLRAPWVGPTEYESDTERRAAILARAVLLGLVTWKEMYRALPKIKIESQDLGGTMSTVFKAQDRPGLLHKIISVFAGIQGVELDRMTSQLEIASNTATIECELRFNDLDRLNRGMSELGSLLYAETPRVSFLSAGRIHLSVLVYADPTQALQVLRALTGIIASHSANMTGLLAARVNDKDYDFQIEVALPDSRIASLAKALREYKQSFDAEAAKSRQGASVSIRVGAVNTLFDSRREDSGARLAHIQDKGSEGGVHRYFMPREHVERFVAPEILLIFDVAESLGLSAKITGGTARDFALSAVRSWKHPLPSHTDFDIVLPHHKDQGPYYSEADYSRLIEAYSEAYRKRFGGTTFPQVDFSHGIRVEGRYIYEHFYRAHIDHPNRLGIGEAFSISKLAASRDAEGYWIEDYADGIQDLLGGKIRVITGESVLSNGMLAKMIGRYAKYRHAGLAFDDSSMDLVRRSVAALSNLSDTDKKFFREELFRSTESEQDLLHVVDRFEVQALGFSRERWIQAYREWKVPADEDSAGVSRRQVLPAALALTLHGLSALKRALNVDVWPVQSRLHGQMRSMNRRLSEPGPSTGARLAQVDQLLKTEKGRRQLQKMLRPERLGGVGGRQTDYRRLIWKSLLQESFGGLSPAAIDLGKTGPSRPLPPGTDLHAHALFKGVVGGGGTLWIGGRNWGTYESRAGENFVLEWKAGWPSRLFFERDASAYEYLPIRVHEDGASRVVDVYSNQVSRARLQKIFATHPQADEVSVVTDLSSEGQLQIAGGKPKADGSMPVGTRKRSDGTRKLAARPWAKFGADHTDERVEVVFRRVQSGVHEGVVDRVRSLEKRWTEIFSLVRDKERGRLTTAYWGALTAEEFNQMDQRHEIYRHRLDVTGHLSLGGRNDWLDFTPELGGQPADIIDIRHNPRTKKSFVVAAQVASKSAHPFIKRNRLIYEVPPGLPARSFAVDDRYLFNVFDRLTVYRLQRENGQPLDSYVIAEIPLDNQDGQVFLLDFWGRFERFKRGWVEAKVISGEKRYVRILSDSAGRTVVNARTHQPPVLDLSVKVDGNHWVWPPIRVTEESGGGSAVPAALESEKIRRAVQARQEMAVTDVDPSALLTPSVRTLSNTASPAAAVRQKRGDAQVSLSRARQDVVSWARTAIRLNKELDSAMTGKTYPSNAARERYAVLVGEKDAVLNRLKRIGGDKVQGSVRLILESADQMMRILAIAPVNRQYSVDAFAYNRDQIRRHTAALTDWVRSSQNLPSESGARLAQPQAFSRAQIVQGIRETGLNPSWIPNQLQFRVRTIPGIDDPDLSEKLESILTENSSNLRGAIADFPRSSASNREAVLANVAGAGGIDRVIEHALHELFHDAFHFKLTTIQQQEFYKNYLSRLRSSAGPHHFKGRGLWMTGASQESLPQDVERLIDVGEAFALEAYTYLKWPQRSEMRDYFGSLNLTSSGVRAATGASAVSRPDTSDEASVSGARLAATGNKEREIGGKGLAGFFYAIRRDWGARKLPILLGGRKYLFQLERDGADTYAVAWGVDPVKLEAPSAELGAQGGRSASDLAAQESALARGVHERLDAAGLSADKRVLVKVRAERFLPESEIFSRAFVAALQQAKGRAYGRNARFIVEGEAAQRLLAWDPDGRVLDRAVPADWAEAEVTLDAPENFAGRGVRVPVQPMDEGDVPAFESLVRLAIESGRVDLAGLPEGYVEAYGILTGERPDKVVLAGVLSGAAGLDTVRRFALKAVQRVDLGAWAQFMRMKLRQIQQSA